MRKIVLNQNFLHRRQNWMFQTLAKKGWKRSFGSLPQTEPLPSVPPLSNEPLKPLQSHITQLSNGVKVGAITSSSPIATLGLFVRAGSRFETDETVGSAFFLKRQSFQDTENRTSLRLVREIEILGSNLEISVDREVISYCFKFTPENLQSLVPILADLLKPRIEEWNVRDERPNVVQEAEELQRDANFLIYEMLHQEAYRNQGLGNGIFTPSSHFTDLHHTKLQQFISQRFTSNNIGLIATGGVNYQEFSQLAQQHFSNLAPKEEQTQKSIYFGGDSRLSVRGAPTHIALAFQGFGLGNKELLVLDTISHLLGKSGSFSKSLGHTQGRLHQAFQSGEKSSSIHQAFSFNIPYSDSGLFGAIAVADPGNAEYLVNTVIKQLSLIKAGSIDASELNRAKAKQRNEALFSFEDPSLLTKSSGYSLLLTGKFQNLDSISAIQSISMNDVVSVAKKVLQSKPTLVAIGDVQNLPTIEAIQKQL